MASWIVVFARLDTVRLRAGGGFASLPNSLAALIEQGKPELSLASLYLLTEGQRRDVEDYVNGHSKDYPQEEDDTGTPECVVIRLDDFVRKNKGPRSGPGPK